MGEIEQHLNHNKSQQSKSRAQVLYAVMMAVSR